jgi:hypothetical protein
MENSFRFALVIAFQALLVAPSAADWYERGHGRAPVGNRVFVCHGYTCRVVTPVTFSATELASIAGALVGGVPDAAAERAAVGTAVQTFEAIVGARIGTSGDLAGMQFGRGSDDQLDCIDEATNTTSLLLLLAGHGYLRHHSVREPSARGFFLDGRYPHATAVLAENGMGATWAIDSWPRANAEPPVIQPLPEWKRARAGELPPSLTQ